ncbi:HEAT repeat domain-containing protein [Phycicoccus sp. SLBN-51]|uniref:HEAT repeat domain-containing protein n=1 Tax=Phycicoccus sp. SLBN-51 TaxID=2768447 RepID=UPI0011508D15|nr:HEAT repeat domain-containing protein [Phycicoccus sp. SLBN-51]
MTRVEEYRTALRELPNSEWRRYLTDHSNLPGPRGNIELAQAFADEATPEVVEDVLATGHEYLTFAGVVALGQQLAEHPSRNLEDRLRGYASDERWRVREAVAMALQRVGDADLPRLLTIVRAWARDPDPLVQRAAVAGICEPRLLAGEEAVAAALEACGAATERLAATPPEQRRDAHLRVLRQGLGYCWSVAVAADPARGLPLFTALTEEAEAEGDADLAWVVRENRRKKRLAQLL